MSHELKEGKELKSVYWTSGDYVVGKEYVARGKCLSLTVREQMGQMSMVPWVEAVFEEGPNTLVNCTHMEGILL